MTSFSIVLGVLVAIAVVIFILAGIIAGSTELPEDRSERQLAAAAERLKPVGQVVVAGSPEAAQLAAAPAAAAAAKPALTGEQAVAQACAACHTPPGLPTAPKIGNQEEWQPRFAKGMDTLLNHAINGFNAMPPQGTVLDEQSIKNAIVYMLNQSGIQVEAEQPQQVATAQPAEQPAAPPQTTTQTAAAQPAEQPASAASASAAPAAPAAAGAAAVPASVDAAKGKEIYDTACTVCHQAGIAGAPKLGDKAAWAPRTAQGWDVLVAHALKGFKAMPAKGGRMDLPDEQVINAIGYMVSQAQ
jgi:cytochrome c5